MKLWSLKYLIGYVIKAIFLLLVAIVFADVLRSVLSPLGSPSILQLQWQSYRKVPPIESDEEKVARWRNMFSSAEKPLITRKINISMQDGKAILDFILTISSPNPNVDTTMQSLNVPAQSHFIVDALARGSISYDIQNFVTAIFGVVRLDDKALSSNDYAIPVWASNSETGITTVTISASKNASDFSRISIDRSQSKTVTSSGTDQIDFILNGWGVQSVSSNFLNVSSEKILFTEQSTRQNDFIYAYLTSPSVEWKNGQYFISSNAKNVPFDSRQSFLQSLPNILNIPLVSSLLFCLIEVLPLIVFLLIVSRSTDNKLKHIESLVKMVLGFLVFHFIVYALGGAGGLLYSPVVEMFSQRTSQLLNHLGFDFSSYWIESSESDVEFVVLGILLPAMLFKSTGFIESPKKWFTIFVWLISALLLIASIFTPILYIFMPDDNYTFDPIGFPLWILVSLCAGIIIILIYLSFLGLYQHLSNDKPHSTIILLAVLLLLVIIAIDILRYSYHFNDYEQYFWLSFVALLGANLFLSFLITAYGPAKIMFRLPTMSNFYKFGVIVILILLSVPFNKIVFPSENIASQYNLSSLAYHIDNFIIFAWIALIVIWLYLIGRSGLGISPLTRNVGILLATGLVVNYTSNWMYIPINFLIGLFAFSYLIRPAEYWQALQPFFKRVVSKRQTLLEKIVTLNTAEKSYQDLHKQLSRKLSAGEIDVADFETQLLKRRKELDDRNSKARLNKQPIKELALAFGPYPSSWENAMHGAKWATIFALPWIALGLREFLLGPMQADSFPLLSFLVNILSLLGKWIGLGFVFGYLYPYLRGQNGLQKGLRLFIVIMVCALPITIIFNTTITAWQASLFWMLQVFIHCMLLGLVAFDYMTLREGYRDWQMLFEVHGIPSIGLSVSSIIAAIGVAAITLLTTQATNLVALAMQYVLPQIPNIDQLAKSLVQK